MADWLLIDGSSIIFRAFFGVPRTVNDPEGVPVNAVRGFLDYLARFILDRHPRNLAVAADDDWRPPFRVDLLPSYKAHRVAEPIPPDLAPQMPIIDDVLDAFGIARVGASGFEAEDIIATLAARATGTIEIISGDRDLFALVRDPDIVVLYPESAGRLARVDETEIEKRYGIPGRSYLDFAVLRGDPSDGLPGVPGIGPKKAAALVNRYGDIESIMASSNFGPDVADYVRRARQVVRPVADIPLPPIDCALPKGAAHPEKLEELSNRYNLKSPTARLLGALAAAASRDAVS
jgi:5'-3' exonuclease